MPNTAINLLIVVLRIGLTVCPNLCIGIQVVQLMEVILACCQVVN